MSWSRLGSRALSLLEVVERERTVAVYAGNGSIAKSEGDGRLRKFIVDDLLPMSTPSLFKWHDFQADIILLNIRWYCCYVLSYRDRGDDTGTGD
jgi:hypothetical protein